VRPLTLAARSWIPDNLSSPLLVRVAPWLNTHPSGAARSSRGRSRSRAADTELGKTIQRRKFLKEAGKSGGRSPRLRQVRISGEKCGRTTVRNRR